MVFLNNTTKKYIYWSLLSFIFLLSIFIRTKLYISQNVFEDDECRLTLCIIDKHLLSSFAPLGDAQSAPPLFVLFSKILGNIFGYKEKILKIFPYISSLIGIYFFYKISGEYLKNKFSILAANYIFALAKPLISFSSIFKQYSSDVSVCLITLYYLWKIKIYDLTKKQAICLSMCITILPLISLPTLFFIATFLVINIKENLKNRDFYIKLLKIILPFICLMPLYYIFILNPERIDLNLAFPNYWNDGFFAFSIKDFIRFIVVNLKFYFMPNTLTLVQMIFLFIGFGIFCKKLERKNLFLVSVSILVLMSAVLKLYPLVGRIGLYYLPICILFITKPLDYVSKKLLIPILMLWIFSFYQYNFAYIKDSTKLDNFVKYSPDKLMKIIKENYNPQKDIILVNNASAASYLFYSGKNNFFSENVYEMLVRKNEEGKAISYLNSLENGHGYWIYMVKDYAKAQIFPLVLGWAKTEKVKQCYKEGESYLLYIER